MTARASELVEAVTGSSQLSLMGVSAVFMHFFVKSIFPSKLCRIKFNTENFASLDCFHFISFYFTEY